MEQQLSVLQGEKDSYAKVMHGLRGCVDQTSLVLERSKARFSRLHDQLSVTRESLTYSQLGSPPHPQGTIPLFYNHSNDWVDEVMSVNELYHENEDLRNTVSFIQSQLMHASRSRGRRSPSPTGTVRPNGFIPTSDDPEKERLVFENKDLREKVHSAAWSVFWLFSSYEQQRGSWRALSLWSVDTSKLSKERTPFWTSATQQVLMRGSPSWLITAKLFERWRRRGLTYAQSARDLQRYFISIIKIVINLDCSRSMPHWENVREFTTYAVSCSLCWILQQLLLLIKPKHAKCKYSDYAKN